MQGFLQTLILWIKSICFWCLIIYFWCLMFSLKHPLLEEVIRRITNRMLNYNFTWKKLNSHDFTIWCRTVYDAHMNIKHCKYQIGHDIKPNMYSNVIHYNNLNIN